MMNSRAQGNFGEGNLILVDHNQGSDRIQNQKKRKQNMSQKFEYLAQQPGN